jgi:hypothetical protein
MNLSTLLFLTVTTTTLVLHSGDRIAVDGAVTEDHGRVTFRVNGTLYSMSASEIARVEQGAPRRQEPVVVSASEPEKLRLRVSEERARELLAELEKNRSGLPPITTFEAVRERPAEEVKAESREEWSWRREIRSYEEAVRRAEEDLQLLLSREAELQQRIFTFVSNGYKPHQFTYDSLQLIRTRERIPYAELEVQRAHRALAEFREDARRQGVLPGWLR